MAAKALRKDLPLHRDISARFLPWLIALMVYLAAVALAAALAVQEVTARWDRGLSDRATVQVPPPGTASGDSLEARVEVVVETLRSAEGVRDVRVMSDAEVTALIEPWLGQADTLGDLPLPSLIAVRFDSISPAQVQALRDRIAAKVPGAVLDDHREWLGDLLEFTGTVQILAALIVLLVSAAAVASVIFVTRTGLAIHHRVIEVLHLIGAQDSYVARQFQSHALGLGLKGGCVGLILAVLTILGVQYLLSDGERGLVPELPLGPVAWSLLALLPVATALVAMLTARWTVLRTLAKMA